MKGTQLFTDLQRSTHTAYKILDGFKQAKGTEVSREITAANKGTIKQYLVFIIISQNGKSVRLFSCWFGNICFLW